ncbi:hypothetical protein IB211_00624c [Intestinimonas butyriciproducens]|uniref:Uncharacterized protein n=1 Tax=Intestinimonas butyriciproducens TaxID=1297617 RepID=A0A0S2W0Z3_9FIRM|nr:hypothetical protein IB211_00624c [Intestinimonas butyriciproducens]
MLQSHQSFLLLYLLEVKSRLSTSRYTITCWMFQEKYALFSHLVTFL